MSMLSLMGALEIGLIFALVALGVWISFRVLDFPDLTADGSFPLGGAVAAVLIVGGWNPWLACGVAALAGAGAGLVTGWLNVRLNILQLLASILTMIALYSINLRIMGRANVPLLRTETLFTPLREAGLLGTFVSVAILAGLLALFVIALVWFLSTDVGLALRATGDNEGMARAQGINTDLMKCLGLSLSNGMVALSGALFAQYQGSADIGMGIGLIVAGLASVIIGQALLPSRRFIFATLAVVVGSVVYRLVIQVALGLGFDPNDMKLISAVLVILALLLPRLTVFRRMRARSRQRRLEAAAVKEA